MFKSDVLCIGSATVDTFLTINQPFSTIKKGDKILVQSIEKYSGGGATNSAAALTKMGLKVKVIIKLGKDHDAEFIVKDLRKYKIKNLSKSPSKKNTDSAFIVTSTTDQDRVIYNHKGASLDLNSSDLKKSLFRTKWIYLASPMGKTLDTIKQIMPLIKKNKISVLFNPSLYLAKQGYSKLKPFLEGTNILVLNKEEAQALLKTKNKSVSEMLRKLSQLGPETVVITDSHNKLTAYHQNEVYSLIPPKVKIIDTTGAGDAFNSGLLSGIIKRYPFEEALKLGQVNASSIIQHLGAKNKLLTESEAKEQIPKIKVVKYASRN